MQAAAGAPARLSGRVRHSHPFALSSVMPARGPCKMSVTGTRIPPQSLVRECAEHPPHRRSRAPAGTHPRLGGSSYLKVLLRPVRGGARCQQIGDPDSPIRRWYENRGKTPTSVIPAHAGIQSPATVVNSDWRRRSHFHPLGVPVATGMGRSRAGGNPSPVRGSSYFPRAWEQLLESLALLNFSKGRRARQSCRIPAPAWPTLGGSWSACHAGRCAAAGTPRAGASAPTSRAA